MTMPPKYGRTIIWAFLVLITQFGLHAGFYEHFTLSILADAYAVSGIVLFFHWFFWEKLKW